MRIFQIGFSALTAIGPETYHGQHRGTGAGLQWTANRVAGIMVSRCLLGLFLVLNYGNCF